MLESLLDEPLKITEKSGRADLNNFIKNHVLFGEEYVFWKRDPDRRTVTYTQLIGGHKLFENTNGQLTFYFNGDNNVISYFQTYLEDTQELSKHEKLIQPLKAIETLYTNGYLKPKDKIVDVELGYYTLVPLSDTTQVLNPAWRFIVNEVGNENKNENLFVSAFEGKIIDLEKNENDVVE
jgi:regulatory protein YycI of two-component signal transduction system YycFG